VKYSGNLDYVIASVKQLTADQVWNYSKKLGVRNLDMNDLYKNPMILTLVCKSNEFLKGVLISRKDLGKLEIQAGNNHMELIANYFIAQKVKHYRRFGCLWSDTDVVLRSFAYDIVLPQIARVFFERNLNSLSRKDTVSILLEYFRDRINYRYESSLMREIFKYGSIITVDEEFINNSLLIRLLSDELSILRVSERVSFVSEVFQDFFLAYQISKEIKVQDNLSIPLIKSYRMGYDQLKNTGDLLHEYRFADPSVSSRNVSHVELFLNKYRNIYDGTTSILVKNVVEIMRIARKDLILADLSCLDLTQANLSVSSFSTIDDFNYKLTSFFGSYLSKGCFFKRQHYSSVDKIFVSKRNKLIASYSDTEKITKFWNIKDGGFVSQFYSYFEQQYFHNEDQVIGFNGVELILYSINTSKVIHSYSVHKNFRSNACCNTETMRVISKIENHLYIGFEELNNNEENKSLTILDFIICRNRIHSPRKITINMKAKSSLLELDSKSDSYIKRWKESKIIVIKSNFPIETRMDVYDLDSQIIIDSRMFSKTIFPTNFHFRDGAIFYTSFNRKQLTWQLNAWPINNEDFVISDLSYFKLGFDRGLIALGTEKPRYGRNFLKPNLLYNFGFKLKDFVLRKYSFKRVRLNNGRLISNHFPYDKPNLMFSDSLSEYFFSIVDDTFISMFRLKLSDKDRNYYYLSSTRLYDECANKVILNQNLMFIYTTSGKVVISDLERDWQIFDFQIANIDTPEMLATKNGIQVIFNNNLYVSDNTHSNSYNFPLSKSDFYEFSYKCNQDNIPVFELHQEIIEDEDIIGFSAITQRTRTFAETKMNSIVIRSDSIELVSRSNPGSYLKHYSNGNEVYANHNTRRYFNVKYFKRGKSINASFYLPNRIDDIYIDDENANNWIFHESKQLDIKESVFTFVYTKACFLSSRNIFVFSLDNLKFRTFKLIFSRLNALDHKQTGNKDFINLVKVRKFDYLRFLNIDFFVVLEGSCMLLFKNKNKSKSNLEICLKFESVQFAIFCIDILLVFDNHCNMIEIELSDLIESDEFKSEDISLLMKTVRCQESPYSDFRIVGVAFQGNHALVLSSELRVYFWDRHLSRYTHFIDIKDALPFNCDFTSVTWVK
jgi:hypothetical protein